MIRPDQITRINLFLAKHFCGGISYPGLHTKYFYLFLVCSRLPWFVPAVFYCFLDVNVWGEAWAILLHVVK